MGEAFHRRGHHVQKAHGRRAQFATDGSHLSGGMIALMPTPEDAKRLALPGGEKAADLHCTLFFLGDEGSAWTEDQRTELEGIVRSLVGLYELEPVQARVFGVAHWNGGSESASWVWNVGDAERGEGVPASGLRLARALATEALESTHDRPETPPQHSPWAAHICAAYDSDLTLVRALEKRLGPVTFDRIRLSFGDDDRDIPLGAGALTAAGFRRDPLPQEEYCDFAEHNRQWEGAVASTQARLYAEMADWRAQIRAQIIAGADTPEELAGLALDPVDAADVLGTAMLDLARRAGQSLQREAEKQGIKIPEWELPDDTVTAAVGGRRLLRSVAQMTADLLATSVVQSAKRVVTGLFAQDSPPERIAAEVDRVLQEQQDSLTHSQVGTAMSTAQTAGRQAVLEAAPPGEYYASEMLDKNTCAACRAVDGEQFSSLEIAIKAYPVMGYKDCIGPRYGNSCRGMIVARWQPEPEPEGITAGAVEMHGSLGDPDYHTKHPGNRGKGLRQLPPPRGGMIGSPDFTEAEHTEALESYVDAPDVNRWLRSGEVVDGRTEDDVKREAKALDDLIQVQEPLAEDQEVLRGGSKLPPMQVGDSFTDRGFSSATTDEATANLFAMAPLMRGESEKGDTLTITIPAGSRVLEVYSVYPHGNEDEWIFPPGTTFEVTGVTDDGYEVRAVVP